MAELAQVLRHVVPLEDSNALVGHSTRDDAAVYRVTEDKAVAVTIDFFTPIVDDPYDFGCIAAANALSDLYAMGARPLFVLNLVGFPRALLSEGILEEILRGSNEVARKAGVPTLGGHSIDDAEPKFGMVAIGEVHPDNIMTNAGARPGDAIVLTKPVGSGVIATAIKDGAADKDVVLSAVKVMSTLNQTAADAMLAVGAHAATDVTGFGLLGHLHQMLVASGVAARLRADSVPVLPGSLKLAKAGYISGGTQRNLDDLASTLDFAETVDADTRALLGDPQTSGGLLICVPPARLDQLLADLEGKTPAAAVVGSIINGNPGHITIQ
jgi:selenide,water dikinase